MHDQLPEDAEGRDWFLVVAASLLVLAVLVVVVGILWLGGYLP